MATNQPSAKKRQPAKAALCAGDRAPRISLEDDEGNARSLDDFAGQWIVLYFYPKDNTPGCTREAQAFRDAAPELARLKAVVVGVSRDSVASHAKFKEKFELPFPLLSDPTTETHTAYGAFGEKVMYGKAVTGALRTTVLIRPDGTVARVFRNVKVDGHVEAVLKALREGGG